MRSPNRSAAIAIVAAIIASASLPSKAATSALEACSLLTKEDAAAALGVAVSGPESHSGLAMGPGATASNCSYSGSGLERLNLNLIQMSPDMATMYRAMCAEKDHTGLTGLGDISCWYSDRHEELQVLKGTTFISIELHKGGNPTEAIKGVMKKALAHLED